MPRRLDFIVEAVLAVSFTFSLFALVYIPFIAFRLETEQQVEGLALIQVLVIAWYSLNVIALYRYIFGLGCED